MTMSDSLDDMVSTRRAAGPVRQLIGGLDGHISRANGIQPFTMDPRCILRIALMPASRRMILSDGAEIRAGDRIADIHCWNERVPAMPPSGPDLVWAQDTGRRLRISLRLLAAEMLRQPALQDVRACRARVNLVGQGGSNISVSRIIARMGFEDVPEAQGSPWMWLHDRCENLFTAALVWTYNPKALRRDKMVRERRPVWASRARVLALHGEPACAASPDP